MTERFRLTLGQMNPTAGDLPGNAALARQAWQAGREAGAQMVAMPEMFLAGARTADILTKPGFLRDLQDHLIALAAACADGPALGIGAPWQDGAQVFNAYVILQGGKVAQRVLKHQLPDPAEARLFDAAPISGPYAVAGLRLGSPIGADAAQADVAETLEETGADLLLVPDSAPYRRGIRDLRLNHMVARVVETGLPLIYLNRTGAEAHDVFDGGSFALNPGGALAQQLPVFDDLITHIDLERDARGWRIMPGAIAAQPDTTEQDYRALVLGLRDHLRKLGQTTAILDFAGGLASAVTAIIAVDALGPKHLHGLMLGEEASQEAVEAETLARTLGCGLHSLPLAALHSALAATLPDTQGHAARDAALRGLLLTLSAGSEAALLSAETRADFGKSASGAAGGIAYAPLCDLDHAQVAALCEWRNAHHRDWMRGPAGPLFASPRADAADAATAREAMLQILSRQDGSVADCVAAGHERATAQSLAAQIQTAARVPRTPGPRLDDQVQRWEWGAVPLSFWKDPS